MALDLGMLGADDLNAQVAAGDIDTVIVGFTATTGVSTERGSMHPPWYQELSNPEPTAVIIS